MTRRRNWLLFLVPVAFSCGGDAGVTVMLLTVPGEDPYQGLSTLRLLVEQQSPGRVILDENYPASQQTIELPPLPNSGPVRFFVDGYQDQELTILVSRGASTWINPRAGETVQVDVCFCRVETIEAGGCDCSE